MRAQILSAMALATLLAGCGGSQQAAGTSPGGGSLPMAIAFDDDHVQSAGDFTVGVRLTNEKSSTSKKYGAVLGYFKSTKSLTSEVVTIPAGSSVVFTNVDSSLPHTGSLLGDATKKSAPWPSTFTGSSNASKAGTDISTTDFSTGTIDPGGSSAVYTASVPGFYMFGCAFHYISHGMRDIIIVK
jgi:plastocyanin